MGDNVPGTEVPAIETLKFIVLKNQSQIVEAMNNGSLDITFGSIDDIQKYNISNS